MFTLTVLGTATPHPLPDRACSGYLVTAGDTRVWVDAGPGSLANLLLCEAESDRWTSDAPQGHHTPEDAGALARRAGAGRLLVTHVGPTLTPEAATARAAHVFGGPTACARESEVHAIG
ncbi:hypothetical protein [Nocardioides sp. Arc9.136]|uniref:hypothetical protein n=1 Tax=Nocardioides sp. Arc9.136 TaxID=2996826 RepID=UPI0026663E17|nr:hypothetical protein [Nocardioides sp. Arc9.136]WKN47701.1 hypothetical protein OSR43_16880 [Nocardioides sp. Arc9.136]